MTFLGSSPAQSWPMCSATALGSATVAQVVLERPCSGLRISISIATTPIIIIIAISPIIINHYHHHHYHLHHHHQSSSARTHAKLDVRPAKSLSQPWNRRFLPHKANAHARKAQRLLLMLKKLRLDLVLREEVVQRSDAQTNPKKHAKARSLPQGVHSAASNASSAPMVV